MTIIHANEYCKTPLYAHIKFDGTVIFFNEKFEIGEFKGSQGGELKKANGWINVCLSDDNEIDRESGYFEHLTIRGQKNNQCARYKRHLLKALKSL